MNVERVNRPSVQVCGIAERTNNQVEAGPEGKISGLWGQFFQHGLLQQPGLNPEFIYGLYTEYESDVNGEYTVLLGCETTGEGSSDQLNHFKTVSVSVPASDYLVFTSNLGPVDTVVPEIWQEIWSYFQECKESRTYTGDFELYKVAGFDPSNTVVQIYIAVK
ncbi:GyrI-like domain-containing protein [Paenibacillus dakarensis]|uniref:GyrI-like domain-containing protein n=1 Tax=Paenibacillus dakarensis TaxID=1527293 RepID=UPI0006D594F9|nr:GyrI-like domain-containing protein [Paenibacillus dakarensis]